MDSEDVRLVDVAEILGVTKQRAHQLAAGRSFPAPVARDGRRRVWDRREIDRWANTWRSARPWR